MLSVVKYAVIPGFYGCTGLHDKDFQQMRLDVSGAIIARAVGADVYENWTDVDGFLTTDPRVVDKPRLIDNISYKELRELSYMGANVLHPEAIFPVAKKNIPINIKNTFNPSHPGTMIVPAMDEQGQNSYWYSGQKGFTVIQIEKSMMNTKSDSQMYSIRARALQYIVRAYAVGITH